MLPRTRQIFSSEVYVDFKWRFLAANIDACVTIVGRSNGKPIPQHNPVVYLNHCCGYDNGRCDALGIVANSDWENIPIPRELNACADSAKIVLVRDSNHIDLLLAKLPQIQQKMVVLPPAICEKDANYLTTGCIVAELFYRCGISVEFIGFKSSAAVRNYICNTGNFDGYHTPTVEREIDIFMQIGAFR